MENIIMNKQYHVIALDMDGTALNDKKQMGERTRQSIHKALASGKEVVFCTGRSLDEMTDILEEFPEMHYVCLESGAMLYDQKEKKVLAAQTIDPDAVLALQKISEGRDLLVQIFSNGRCLLNENGASRLAYYHMGVYQEMYDRVATPVPDVFQLIASEGAGAEKINLYHTSPEDRTISRARILEQNLPLTLVDSEVTSLECTAPDVSKAVGLQALCEILHITMDNVIMVGDAPNDLTALQAAGLAVAMKNAHPQIKAICDVVVADNNHDGCAEAIETYLLS